MLKIKDYINLKELEKFGFFKDNIICENVYRKINKIKRGKQKFECEWIIWNNRGIDVYSNRGFLDDTLYDLIQARISRKSR